MLLHNLGKLKMQIFWYVYSVHKVFVVTRHLRVVDGNDSLLMVMID